MSPPRLILASGSPRRRQFLQGLGLTFEVFPADLDETPRPDEGAAAYVRRIASEKAKAVAGRFPDAVVLAADTTVVRDDTVLGKPANEEEVVAMLRSLSGRAHQVLTAVALGGRGSGEALVRTEVRMRTLQEPELRWYARTGEALDKAGGYALQGIAGSFVTEIHGSHSNVVGLPLVETVALLQAAGILLPWEAAR